MTLPTRLRRRWRRGAAILAASGLIAAGSNAQAADGHIELETTNIAAGVGLTWGDGVLVHEGRRYAFHVSGLSVAEIGFARSSAEGPVYHLENPEDLAGRYVVAEASASLGGGMGALMLTNQRGVAILLHSVEQGVRLTLANKGVEIELSELPSVAAR